MLFHFINKTLHAIKAKNREVICFVLSETKPVRYFNFQLSGERENRVFY